MLAELYLESETQQREVLQVGGGWTKSIGSVRHGMNIWPTFRQQWQQLEQQRHQRELEANRGPSGT